MENDEKKVDQKPAEEKKSSTGGFTVVPVVALVIEFIRLIVNGTWEWGVVIAAVIMLVIAAIKKK